MPPRLRGLLLLAPFLLAGTDDPGLLIEIDRDRFELRAMDLADLERGPALGVALGSPAHPTPSGEFVPRRVIGNPSWWPGPVARSFGARPHGPSSDGPLGALKIPLRGSIALHGGAHPLEIGKPISLGCVSTLDDELRGLVEWLRERGALVAWEPHGGELHSTFRRPLRVIVR